MTEKPRISLIATFYNCKSCVVRCMESLMGQTHENYEIVLVDDGSTDGTYELLEAYSDEGHVRCFTKPNGGAGSARNFGVAQARGEYVSFVDGDDYILPSYLSTLDRALTDTGCNFACARCRRVTQDDSGFWEPSQHDIAFCLSAREAIEMLAYEELTESPCAKLGPRTMYVDHPFPERYYEDVAAAAEHMLVAAKVAYVECEIYAYVMNEGSIVHRKSVPLLQLEDFVWAADRMVSVLEAELPNLAGASAFRRSLLYARAHRLVRLVSDDVDAANRIDKGLIQTVRRDFQVVKGDPRVPRAQKARFWLLKSAPWLYDAIFYMYDCRKLRTKS